MKAYLDQIKIQLPPIIISALMAAGVAFIQALAVKSGACPGAAINPEAAAGTAALFKTAHSAWSFRA